MAQSVLATYDGAEFRNLFTALIYDHLSSNFMNAPETQSAVSSMRLLGELVETLTSSMHEIRNLRDKLANKEEEGWEGSRRRCVLKIKTEEVLAKARTELKKATDGDGI